MSPPEIPPHIPRPETNEGFDDWAQRVLGGIQVRATTDEEGEAFLHAGDLVRALDRIMTVQLTKALRPIKAFLTRQGVDRTLSEGLTA